LAGIRPWTAPGEVVQDGIANLLGERESAWASLLAVDGDGPGRPVDVIQLQMNDIARSEPEPRQQKENRPVSQSNRLRKLRCTDNPFYLIWRQVGGQRSQAPVGDGGDRVHEQRVALALPCEKPEKHPDLGQDFLPMFWAESNGAFRHEPA
jgi:hypothetical protein